MSAVDLVLRSACTRHTYLHVSQRKTQLCSSNITQTHSNSATSNEALARSQHNSNRPATSIQLSASRSAFHPHPRKLRGQAIHCNALPLHELGLMLASVLLATKVDVIIARAQRRDLGLCEECGGLYDADLCNRGQCPLKTKQ